MRVIILFALLVGTSSVIAAENVYYFDLVNTTPKSIKTFSLAPVVGNTMFRKIHLERPLAAGDSISIATRRSEGGCLRDLRTEFSTGDVLVRRFFNACEQRNYDVGQSLHGQDKAVELTQP